MSNTVSLAQGAITTSSRVITVFSQQGKNNNPITFEGRTWGELKKVLKSAGYNIEEMTALESIGNHELSVNEAIIPTEDFFLHLFPVETKSGAAKKAPLPSRKELNAEVKAFTDTYGKEAKEFFKGYTNLPSAEVAKLVTKFSKKVEKKGVPVKETVSETGAKAPKAKKATASSVLGSAKLGAAVEGVAQTGKDLEGVQEVLATPKVTKTSEEAQKDYYALRTELSKNYNGKHNRVRG